MENGSRAARREKTNLLTCVVARAERGLWYAIGIESGRGGAVVSSSLALRGCNSRGWTRRHEVVLCDLYDHFVDLMRRRPLERIGVLRYAMRESESVRFAMSMSTLMSMLMLVSVLVTSRDPREVLLAESVTGAESVRQSYFGRCT